MKHVLIFIASLFLAFAVISSTASASPSEWGPAARASVAAEETGGSGNIASWATVPRPRLFTFVDIQL